MEEDHLHDRLINFQGPSTFRVNRYTSFKALKV